MKLFWSFAALTLALSSNLPARAKDCDKQLEAPQLIFGNRSWRYNMWDSEQPGAALLRVPETDVRFLEAEQFEQALRHAFYLPLKSENFAWLGQNLSLGLAFIQNEHGHVEAESLVFKNSHGYFRALVGLADAEMVKDSDTVGGGSMKVYKADDDSSLLVHLRVRHLYSGTREYFVRIAPGHKLRATRR